MAEYIEREALLLRIDCHGTNKFGMLDEDIRVFVKSQPTADVAPVVHARWIDGKCSNCGVDIPTDDLYDVIFGNECHFCYYCGAKMDIKGESDV